MGGMSCQGFVTAILKKERKEGGKCSSVSEKCVNFGRQEGNGQHHPVSCLAFANLRLLVSLKCDLFPCCTGKKRRENKSCVALKSERALRPSQCQGKGLLWKKTNQRKVVKSCRCLNECVGGRRCLESKALFQPVEQMFMGK